MPLDESGSDFSGSQATTAELLLIIQQLKDDLAALEARVEDLENQA